MPATRSQNATTLAALALVLLAAGCGPGGQGNPRGPSTGVQSPITGTPTGTGTGPNGGSPTNAPQWQAALAALAVSAQTDPYRLEPAALAAYDAALARNWPHVVPLARAVVDQELRAAVGKALGGLSILSVQNVTIDIAAPPALIASAPAARQTADLLVPAAPGAWAISMTVEAGGTIPFTIAGFTTGIGIRVALEARVTDIRVSQPFELLLTGPGAPKPLAVGTPTIDLKIALVSQDPILSTIAGTLTRILDPVVRVALIAGSVVVQRQVGVVLSQVPNGHAFGRGGPPVQALAAPAPLEPFALGISDEIQRNMTPNGQLFPTIFDTPVQGGNVVGWRHFGDSALWTGAYLACESFRYDLTGDPAALAAATRAVRGIDLSANVVPAPAEGLLARCAAEVGTPLATMIATHGGSQFLGSVRGVPHIGEGFTSRDSYTGTFLGLGQAWHRLPSLRGALAPIVTRLLAYLERNDWAVDQAPGQVNVGLGGPGISVTFIQSPAGMLNLANIGRVVDPVRFARLHADCAPLASMIWFNTWTSSQEIHEGYYKFSLEHMHTLSLLELDADPARYRSYLQNLAMLHDAIGHHQNPWFESVFGMATPGAAPASGPEIQSMLERFTLRPRRGFTIYNSLDPSIQKTTITSTLPSATGGPNSGYQTAPRTQEVAVYPVPIERRPSCAFIFSSSPFDLDGWADPYEQHPGIDFLLPYWISRNHGLIR